jgi:hypothetical protein
MNRSLVGFLQAQIFCSHSDSSLNDDRYSYF